MINWKECEVLDSEEQDRLVRLAIHGDVVARQMLVQSNAKLAKKIAQEYRDFENKHSDDLFQQGMLGLCIAVDRFDPNKGTKFTTYATWWVKALILKHLIDNHRLVRLGKTQAQRKLFFRLRREQRKLAQNACYASQDIAESLGVTKDEVDFMDRMLTASEVSLDTPSNGVTDSGSLIDALPSSDDVEANTIKNKMVSWVQAKMIEFEQRLSGIDLAVWNERIASEDPPTFDTVGQQVGKTRQRVQQIESGLKARFVKFARA